MTNLVMPAAPSAADAAIDIQSLNKSYGPVQALSDVDLSIKPGEIFGLLGPNGAGKTTIIGIVTGSVVKSSGRVRVLGHDVERDYLLTRHLIGVVPQETISDGFFSVYQIMEFQSGFYGLSKNRERIEEILKRLSLWEKRKEPVERLSGGMKRRLLVAKALVHDPAILILDEPTAGVDLFLRYHLWEYVQDINRRGKTILLTTHYIEEAEKLCHRVAFIHQSRIAVVDTVPAILSRYHCRSLEEAFIKITGKPVEEVRA